MGLTVIESRRTYLDLVRIPNVFTAVADILAGYLFVGGGLDDWRTLLSLVATSAFLYSGGVVLNDVCDSPRDAVHRPDRPIPAGRISRRTAFVFATALLAIGSGVALSLSARAAILSGLLVSSIVGYDWVFKTTALAPPLMGLCRTLNLALGMSGNPLQGGFVPLLGSSGALIPLVAIGLYGTSVTFFARHEAETSSPARLVTGTMGLVVAVGMQASLCWIVTGVHLSYLILLGLLICTLAYYGFKAAGCPQPIRVQRATRIFVFSFIFFDTGLAWASGGIVGGVAVVWTALPALLLRRIARMT